jgi:hypothetical protein
MLPICWFPYIGLAPGIIEPMNILPIPPNALMKTCEKISGCLGGLSETTIINLLVEEEDSSEAVRTAAADSNKSIIAFHLLFSDETISIKGTKSFFPPVHWMHWHV